MPMQSLRIAAAVSLALSLLSCGRVRQSAGTCAALDKTASAKLIAYVQKRYNVPPSMPIEVRRTGYVGDSCYQRLDFHASNGQGPLHVVLYASPDLRYLSHDLMDAGGGPVRQETRIRVEATALSRGNPAALGRKDAPVTITVFSDFQCPYCARLADGMKNDILPSEKGKVRVLFRHFPLSMHPWARNAAEAAACARQQGDQYFWSFHDYLFQHQRGLTAENLQKDLAAYSQGLPGFQVGKLKACMDGHTTAAEVDQDLALGREAGVSGTPTVFVGNERSIGYRPDELRTLIVRASGGKGPAPTQASSAPAKQLSPAEVTTALSRGNPAGKGRTDAPVTITLFSDFQCPFCARAAEGLIGDLLPQESGKVRILFRNFPLPMHAWARDAAQAAECARQQSESYFWNFHDYFFQHQKELSPDTLRKSILAHAASLRGLQAPKLQACMDRRGTAAVVDQDIAVGKALGVTGTPTMFVGRERIVGYRADQIRALIEGAAKGGETR
jgi:protein-disulfide isomerase